MPLPTQPLAAVTKWVLAQWRSSYPGLPLGTKKFLGRAARAIALNVWALQAAIQALDLDIVPSALSSTDALSAWAGLLGLPDGQGGFGRLKPTAASGGIAGLTGVKGTVYPNNALATSSDGSTQVQLSGSVTIPGSGGGFGTVNGTFVAVTTGTVGNLPAGTTLSWSSPPAGADPTFTLTSALGGAIDSEANGDLYKRLVARLQTPPHGGNAQDIRTWSQAATAGIAAVYVYGRRSGTGTADAVITAGGSNQGRAPTLAQQAAVQTYVDSLRGLGGEQINVLVPYMPNANAHVVRVRVVPSQTRYAFDWNDVAGFAVDAGGYAAGPPATLRLSGLADITLKNAINLYLAGTGTKPRLQVMSVGSVINPPVGVVAFSDGGGKTTLTLDTVPSGWVAPSAGETVYAYGPVVATIAAGIQALVNSLGPSRMSGYGDALSPWYDTLAINQIARVAEDAIDTDGTPLILEVPVGSATIDGATLDVQATDNTPNSPELLYVSHIAVTQ